MQNAKVRSKFLVWLLVGISIFVALSGCSPKISNQIIGKWEKNGKGEAETIEFKADNTFFGIYATAITLQGIYKFNKDDQLQLIAPNGNTLVTAHAAITNDILTLSYPDNSPTATYTRVGSNQTENHAVTPSKSQLENQSLADYNKSQTATSPAPNANPPKLSAAAEKAIQEGFVEIKDPTVQACTDARITEIKKKNGTDSAISFEAYNEAAVLCGFNI